jgi:hypothetical protein
MESQTTPPDENQSSEARKRPQKLRSGKVHTAAARMAGTGGVAANADPGAMILGAELEAFRALKAALQAKPQGGAVDPMPPAAMPREIHWMTAAGLPPFDPTHHYTNAELRALAAAYCSLHPTRGRPLGGDTGRRRYSDERLLPRIPQCLWPLRDRKSPK